MSAHNVPRIPRLHTIECVDRYTTAGTYAENIKEDYDYPVTAFITQNNVEGKYEVDTYWITQADRLYNEKPGLDPWATSNDIAARSISEFYVKRVGSRGNRIRDSEWIEAGQVFSKINEVVTQRDKGEWGNHYTSHQRPHNEGERHLPDWKIQDLGKEVHVFAEMLTVKERGLMDTDRIEEQRRRRLNSHPLR